MTMKRSTLVLTIAALALLFASQAEARGSRNSVTGEATLGVKDLRAQTLVIGSDVFRVTPETLLRDQDGNLLTLAQIPVPEAGKEGEGDWAVLGARFKAMRIGDDNVLIKLNLIEAPH